MIIIKSPQQQKGVRESAELLSSVFKHIQPMIEPGISTKEIDRFARRIIEEKGGRPAFLGYQGFPCSICTSVNEQVIHGIPGHQRLKNGDIIGCDIGVELNGFFSDASKTFSVGTVSNDVQDLLDITRESLLKAISVCRPGARISDIGKAVTTTISPHGFGIVTSFCGHGVGLAIHEDPQIPNFYPSKGANMRLKSGMILAIEPMINLGGSDVKILDDEWTVVTTDGSLSAHFEHSVLITDKGSEILTSWGDDEIIS